MPLPPRLSPVPPGENEAVDVLQIECVLPKYVYISTPLSNTQMFNLNGNAKDHMCNKHFLPNLLADEGACTG